jgi:hypothetical protein
MYGRRFVGLDSTDGGNQTCRSLPDFYDGPGSKYMYVTYSANSLKDGQRATPTMEERNQQFHQRQHHGMHQHPMHHLPPQAIYGYPIDPSWGGHAMMHQHQMHGAHG